MGKKEQVPARAISVQGSYFLCGDGESCGRIFFERVVNNTNGWSLAAVRSHAQTHTPHRTPRARTPTAPRLGARWERDGGDGASPRKKPQSRMGGKGDGVTMPGFPGRGRKVND